MEILTHAYAELLSTIVEPTKQWLLKRPIWLRIMLLFCLPWLILAGFRPAYLSACIRLAGTTAAVGISGDKIPLSAQTQERLASVASQMELQVESDLDQTLARGPGDSAYAWALAQQIVALRDRDVSIANKLSVINKLRSWQDGSGAFWSPLPGVAQFGATGWCLYSLAAIREPATDGELQFVLARQRSDGGWTLYDGDNEARESVFATAMLLLALHAQLPLQPPALHQRLRTCITRAEGWLIEHGDRARGRWRFFPLLDDSSESESDSGLALFALHTSKLNTGASPAAGLDSAWLDGLPVALPSRPGDLEVSGIWCDFQGKAIFDSVRHLRLPWMIAGTVSTYASGTLLQQSRVVRLLEDSIANGDWRSGGKLDFQRAELLLAITSLQRQLRHRGQWQLVPLESQ